MKKLCIPILILLLGTACSKTGQTTAGGFRLQAGSEQLETRAQLGEKTLAGRYPVIWSKGDRLQINASVSAPLSEEEAGGKTADFSFDAKPAEAASYFISYPPAGEGRVHFPDKQTYVPDNVCDGAMPLFGRASSLDVPVTLKGCSAVVTFLFQGDKTLSRLDITTPGQEKLSGDFTIEGERPVASTGAQARLTYDCGGGVPLTPAGIAVTFAVPLGTYAKGLRAVAHASDGSTMTLGLFTNGVELLTPQVCKFPAIPFQSGKEIILSTTEAFSGEEMDLEGSAGIDDFEGRDASAAVSIKAGTYNIWSPEARKTVMDADATVSPQRSWANSYKSVAEMIKWLDCDVMGLQEITSRAFKTAITGAREDYDGNIHTLNGELSGYSWVIYNGANTTYDSLFPKNTTANGLSNTDAIIYKSSTLTLVSHGRYWITGNKTAAGAPADGYGTNRTAIWAKFTHKASGRQFVFISTHLDLPNAGPAEDAALPQRRNIEELIGWAAPTVCPENLPSVIVGDMNVDAGDTAGNYALLVNGRWKDVYDIMLADGSLPYTDQRLKGTMNAQKNEEGGFSSWRPDHILVDGFTPSYYKVGRETFATADGTLHWPSDHFPIKVILNF